MAVGGTTTVIRPPSPRESFAAGPQLLSISHPPSTRSSGPLGGDEGEGVAGSLEQVVDLVGRLEADDEGVDGTEAEDVAERLVLALGLLDPAFAEDLHADDPLAGVVHLLELRGDLVGLLAVHDEVERIDPGEVDLDER